MDETLSYLLANALASTLNTADAIPLLQAGANKVFTISMLDARYQSIAFINALIFG